MFCELEFVWIGRLAKIRKTFICRTTVRPNPTTPRPNPGPTPDCRSGEEYIPHPSRCTRYVRCVNGQPNDMPCPGGLIFDYSLKVCNWPFAVNTKLPAGCPDAQG